MTHVVLRSFQGLGRVVERGEVVNATSWPSAQALTNQKYIKEASYGINPQACGCGRHWTNREDIERHGCAKESTAGKPGQQKGR